MILNHNNWQKICINLKKNNHLFTRADEIQKLSTYKWVLIKHDIETDPNSALEIAKIESSLDIAATYYIQGDLILKHSKIFKDIESLGHEIAYHYDVLDANDGDFSRAISDFEDNLKNFSKAGFEVKTICPHGNPLMKRNGWSSNRDFFESKFVRNKYSHLFDIVVDINNVTNNLLYISDVGYSFKEIIDISSTDQKNLHKSKSIDINTKLYKHFDKTIVISTHPHRWTKFSISFILKKYFFVLSRNIARYLYKVPIFKFIISKFFFLARKF